MFPEYIQFYFMDHQDLLYGITLILDLGFTILMYRFFGQKGLLACIVLSILLANLQGPKLTVILGMQTSLGVIFYSSIFFATDLLSEKFGKKAADDAEEEKMNEEIEKFEAKYGFVPTPIGVALDSLAVYVHRDNPLSSLSLPQVDAIFSKTRKVFNFKPPVLKFKFSAVLL